MTNDTFLEAFKEKIPNLWAESQNQFDFALACYLQGRADTSRMNDPGFNAAFNVVFNHRGQDDNTTL